MSNLEYNRGGGEPSPDFPDKIRRRRTSTKIIVIICLLAAIVLLLLLSPLFNISEIRVVGNSRLEAESIIKASGIAEGVNVFRVNTGKCEQRLTTMAYVDRVEVVRKFPSVVEIRITESTEIAYVYFIGNYIGIDGTGKILEILPADAAPQLPVILGTNLTEFGIGSLIKIDNADKQNAIFRILKQLDSNQMLPLIKTIDVADLDDIKFFTTSETTVNMGSMEEIIYKISFLRQILEEPGDKRGAVIDMTNPGKVTYRGS